MSILSSFSFMLEPYNGPASRYTCPSCGKARQFSRYVDAMSLEYLSDKVGKCNRMDKCGYHYSPKQFFLDHPHLSNVNQRSVVPQKNKELKNGNNGLLLSSNAGRLVIQRAVKGTNTAIAPLFDVVAHEVFSKSLRRYHLNCFTVGLERLFGTAVAIELIERFSIGTAKLPMNGTVFWQVDTEGKVRTGKIMSYDEGSLKRVKNAGLADGQQRAVDNTQFSGNTPLVDWVHSRLKRLGRCSGFRLQQCLFGLHQLKGIAPDSSVAVGIVESEKTAVIASVFMPQLLWMATGGAQNLNANMLSPLKGHRVFLFPDVNLFSIWSAKAEVLRQLLAMDIVVSDYMEVYASEDMRVNGADLADVLIVRDAVSGLALTDCGYPVFWDC